MPEAPMEVLDEFDNVELELTVRFIGDREADLLGDAVAEGVEESRRPASSRLEARRMDSMTNRA